MEAAKAGSWSWNLATGRVSFSRALLALLHYTPDDVGGRFDDWRLFLRDDFDAFAERMRTMRELCPAVALETRVRLYGKAGDWRWFTLQGDWRWNDLDSSFRLLGVAIDVHEMTLQSEREHAQSTRLAAVLEQMPASADQTVVIEDYGRFNMAAPDGRPLRADKYPLARAVRGLRPVGPEVLLVNRPDGTSASFMVNAGSVRDADGEARIAVSVMHSVELLVRTRTMLAIEKERAHITLRAIGDGVITTDPEGLVVTMNPAAERLTGYTAGVACEQGAERVVALCDELGNAFVRHPVIACLNSESATVAPLRGQLTSRAGTSHVVDFSVAPLRCDSGKLLGAVLVLRDMTEAQRLLDALTWQRTHDTLTGLINREGFGALLEAAVARCHGPGAGDAALLYLDLDQFKVVNETCGHDAGNALLCELGGAYGALAPASATLARIGGDEFALIIGNCSVAQAWDVDACLPVRRTAHQSDRQYWTGRPRRPHRHRRAGDAAGGPRLLHRQGFGPQSHLSRVRRWQADGAPPQGHVLGDSAGRGIQGRSVHVVRATDTGAGRRRDGFAL
jgi:diguanylate cyclase (GGDEF)-like protein/PAS domain S-box-containing protein